MIVLSATADPLALNKCTQPIAPLRMIDVKALIHVPMECAMASKVFVNVLLLMEFKKFIQ